MAIFKSGIHYKQVSPEDKVYFIWIFNTGTQTWTRVPRDSPGTSSSPPSFPSSSGGGEGDGGGGGGGGGGGEGYSGPSIPINIVEPEPDEIITSFFPPLQFSLSCKANALVINGGQDQLLYNVNLKGSADVYDQNKKIFTTYCCADFIDILGPIRAYSLYFIFNSIKNRYDLKFNITHGLDLENLLDTKQDTYNIVNLKPDGCSSSEGIMVGGGFRYFNAQITDVTINRSDNLVDDSGSVIAPQICTLTVWDRSGILFQKDYFGRPTIQTGSNYS